MEKETSVENKSDASNAIDETKLAAAITAGLKAALPDAIKPLVEEVNTAGRIKPVAQTLVATIEDVSEEEIADAIEVGDKTKVAALMRRQRAADNQRRASELAQITRTGGAAFGSVAKIAAEKLPYYNGKWKKLIDAKVDQFRENNPATLILPDHYKAAHDLIVGENWEEIRNADREAQIRQAREAETALEPGESGRTAGVEQPKDASNLQELLAGDWKREFQPKARAVGGRSDDEELRKMGFKGGFKDLLTARKEIEEVDELTGGSLGLDRDWDKASNSWVN